MEGIANFVKFSSFLAHFDQFHRVAAEKFKITKGKKCSLVHGFHSPENPEKSQEKQMQVKKKPKKPEEIMIFLAISDNSSKIFIFRKYLKKILRLRRSRVLKKS